MVPSGVEVPNLELIPLPEDLKYAFLETEKTFAVVISTYLIENQEERLLNVFCVHKAL